MQTRLPSVSARPLALSPWVVNRTSSPSSTNHTGAAWGLPLGDIQASLPVRVPVIRNPRRSSSPISSAIGPQLLLSPPSRLLAVGPVGLLARLLEVVPAHVDQLRALGAPPLDPAALQRGDHVLGEQAQDAGHQQLLLGPEVAAVGVGDGLEAGAERLDVCLGAGAAAEP